MSFRKAWDKEKYEKLAQERLENGNANDHGQSGGDKFGRDDKKVVSDKVEFQEADEDAECGLNTHNALLSARSSKVDVESMIGRNLVTAPSSEGDRGPGFKCEVCNMTYKDSAAYLTHVNSSYHQRNLGFSMQVKKADIGGVRSKFASLKRKLPPKPRRVSDDDEALSALARDNEAPAERSNKTAKTGKDTFPRTEEEEEEEEEEEPQIDPEMAAMLGFGGFGGSRKNG